MTNITIIARYETTAEEVLPFAINKGWKAIVANPVLDEETGLVTYEQIDNPESALEFCNNKAKECLLNFLIGNATVQLEQAKQQEAQEGIALIKQRVSDALTVNQGE